MTPSELVQKVCEAVAISGVITMTTGRVGSKDLRDIAESYAALQRENAQLREALAHQKEQARTWKNAARDLRARAQNTTTVLREALVKVQTLNHRRLPFTSDEWAHHNEMQRIIDAALTPSAAPGEGE